MNADDLFLLCIYVAAISGILGLGCFTTDYLIPHFKRKRENRALITAAPYLLEITEKLAEYNQTVDRR